MRRKHWVAIVALLGTLYVSSYSVLSLNGEYVEYIGGGADGSASWFPQAMQNSTPGPTTGRIDTEYPNRLGFFFGPLLILDRWIFHPDTPGMWDPMAPDHPLPLTGNARDGE